MTMFSVATEKLCRNRENSIATEFSIATKKTLSQQRNSVATETLEKIQKRPKTSILDCFSSPIHPRTINTHFFRFLGQ